MFISIYIKNTPKPSLCTHTNIYLIITYVYTHVCVYICMYLLRLLSFFDISGATERVIEHGERVGFFCCVSSIVLIFNIYTNMPFHRVFC